MTTLSQRSLTRIRDALAARERAHALVDTLRGRAAALRHGHPVRGPGATDLFFIIGSGRSGTTLVRRILMSSPYVHIPPETHVLGPMIGTYRRYAYLPWDELVRLCLARLEFHPEFVHFGMSLGPVARRLAGLPHPQRSLTAILLGVFRAHAECVGRDDVQTFGEKTPNSTEQVHRIRTAFPDARFVHIVRDGLDVACSFAEAGMFPLEEAAQLWVRRTRIARRFAVRYPSSCLTVRYETLVAEPDKVVDDLARFLRLDRDTVDVDEVGHVDEMGDVDGTTHHERVSQPIRTQRVGRWRSTLDADQIRTLERIMGRERQRWGYEPARSST